MQKLASWLGLAVLAGLGLAAIDVAWLVYRHDVSLRVGEYVGVALFVAVVDVGFVSAAAVLALGLRRALGRSVRGRRVRAFAALTAAAVMIALFASLTAGRRWEHHPLRLPGTVFVGVAAALLSLGWGAMLRRVGGTSQSQRLGAATALAVAAVAVAGVEGAVLVRLYPALHVAGALAVAVLAVSAVWLVKPAGLMAKAATSLALVSALIAIPAVALVRRAAPARVVGTLGDWAPVAGKSVAALRDDIPRGVAVARAAPRFTHHKPARLAAGAAAGRVSLAGADVLLITVDALRADALGAYGNSKLTPRIDALAKEAAVFERAYTSTPHTSYALTSLLAGTCSRTAFEVTNPPKLTTLADVLSAAHYQSAAFFPESVFHVDGARFESLRARRFGFGRAVEKDASADERVDEVLGFVHGAKTEDPVFAWAHLFEPHEPYEPDATTTEDSPPRARYDAEVRRIDSAVGALVDGFVAARPHAVVILTADHGEEFGEHGGFFHGTTVYDEQVRVPLVVWSPERIAPSRSPVAVSLADVAPTLLLSMGLAVPRTMSGAPFLDALSGSAAPGRGAVVLAADLFAVTDGHWKLVGNGARGGMLFDLARDPRENDDVSDEHADLVVRMRAQYGEIRGRVVRAQGSGESFQSVLARARVGDQSVAEDVISALGADDAQQRAQAAQAAGELELLDASQVLVRLAETDDDVTVRREAALADVQIRGTTAAPRLLELMNEGDDSFRERAAFALANVKATGAEKVLRTLAGDSTRSDDERRRAVDALGQVKDRDALRLLSKLLEDADFRVNAAHALAAIGDRRALPTLRRALRVETYPAGKSALTDAIAVLEELPAAAGAKL